MPGILADARFAVRALWRHRAFTIASVLTLAIGFGATSAVFSLSRAALLRPLPVIQPDRLVFLHRFETRRSYYSSTSYPAFVDTRGRAADVVELAAYQTRSVSLDDRGGRRLTAAFVSEAYFAVAAVAPMRGRVLRAGDVDRVAVIGERVWADVFQRDETILGRTIVMAGRPAIVIGIAPAGFAGFDRDARVDVWLPIETDASFAESRTNRGRHWLEVVGRLRDGVTREQGEAALRSIGAGLGAQYPETDANWRLDLSPGAQGNLYPHTRRSAAKLLLLINLATLVLLLVTCGTAANLSIARIQSRARELRVRLAIGADRRQLLRLVATEHGLIAAGAVVAGTVWAQWVPGMFAAYALPGSMRISELPTDFDAAQAVFTAGLLAVVAAALTALSLPSWWGSRHTLVTEGARATDRLLVRRALVAAQIGMSLALLFTGGLLFRALRSQIDLDAAFRTQPLLMVSVDLPREQRSLTAAGQASFRSIRERVAAVDGVAAASWSFTVPFGFMRMQTDMTPEGSAAGLQRFDANVIDVDYFRSVRLPILRGRAFAAEDREGAERVMIVTESVAKEFWPDRDPIGRHIAGRAGGAAWTIVGVVPDDLHYDIRTLRGGRRRYVFFPLAQMPQRSMTLFVSTSVAPATVAERVRAIIAEEAPLAQTHITTARRHVDAALSSEWLAAGIGGVTATIALLLATLGLFGLVRYTVTQRSREFAIRLALGATPRGVVRLAFADALGTFSPGVVLGLAIALPLVAAIRPLMHGIDAVDMSVLAGSIAASAAAALIAVWMPARVAAHIDPAQALRTE